ncbi:MAG TPA: vWA domain-containing protein [Phycisphaerales bacterium]|nr:vWA domain-containing protein [Phycisphaerales bacterium]
MTFLHPWVLLLLAVPVLLLWSVVGRGTGVTLPVDHRLQPRRPWLRWTLGAFEIIPLLLLAVALVMLAGPQMLKKPRAERLLTNIQLALDVSGSMSGERYRMASKAINDFTSAREGDAFGLTMFGSHQIRWIPLTRDLAAIRNAMPFADPEHQPIHMSGTAIAAALRFCRANMEAETAEGDRLIVMVSDGASSDLDGGENEKVAEELKLAGITLYHIHVAEGGVPAEVSDMANATGGGAFAANDTDSLKQVFRHIDKMKPAKFAQSGTVPMDHFRPFAIAALVLAGVHVVGLLGARYTPW